MIKEPRVRPSLAPTTEVKQPLYIYIKDSLAKIYSVSKDNMSIKLCLFGNMIIRLSVVLYSTFLLLWITSFVDNGVLKSEEDAKTIYQWT